MAGSAIETPGSREVIVDGNVAIVTDSNVCLPHEIVQRHGIQVVPILVIFGERVLRDGIDITPREFCARLKAGGPMATTSAPSPVHYQEAYKAAREGGARGVVVVCLSSKLSMAYDAACTAARSMGEYPVRVVNSRLATTAQGFVALAAARAAARGADLAGVVAVAEVNIARCGFVAVLDTLSYLSRSGRVPAIAALAGSALKLYPVVANQRDGSVGIVAPVRGKEAALKRMLREVERRTAGQRLAALAIMHAGVPEQVAELQGAVSAQLQVAELYTVEFSPVMVAHAGPGLIGLAYPAALPAAPLTVGEQ